MMKKFLIVLIAFAILFVSSTPVFSTGEEMTSRATIVANSTTTYAGSYAYITVSASDFVNMASLDISVFYDADLMSVNHMSIRSLANGTQYSLNSDTAGEIHFSMIAPTGINGNGDLFQICFRMRYDIAPQRTTVLLAAGGAYDTALNPAQVNSSNGQITISEVQQTLENIFFYSSSVSSAKKGDTFDILFSSSSLRSLAAADFEFYYDATLLKLENVQLGDKLKNAKGAVYAVNDALPGYVKISYVAMEGITGYASPVVKFSFSVRENMKAETFVEMNVSGLCNSQLIAMTSNSVSARVNIDEKEEESLLPTILISSYHGAEQEFSVSVIADGETKLAAGDFTVEYDPSFLVCVSAINKNGAMVIANTQKTGKITFSYVNEVGISEDTELILLTFKKVETNQCSTALKLSGKNLVNAEFNEVKVSYTSSNVTVHTKEENIPCVKDKFCTVCGILVSPKTEHIFDGDDDNECNICGASKIAHGDIDGDGEITMLDSMILMRYIAQWPGYENRIVFAAADLDGDGISATMRDSMILIRHIAEWQGYETLPKI